MYPPSWLWQKSLQFIIHAETVLGSTALILFVGRDLIPLTFPFVDYDNQYQSHVSANPLISTSQTFPFLLFFSRPTDSEIYALSLISLPLWHIRIYSNFQRWIPTLVLIIWSVGEEQFCVLGFSYKYSTSGFDLGNYIFFFYKNVIF